MFKRLIQAAGLLLCCAQFSPVAIATPVVAITAPANNSSYTPPAAITLSATASDNAGGTISKVAFFNGSTLIGTDTTAPYSITWNNVATGKYTITAKATNNSNVTTTSAAISVTVNTRPSISLVAPTASSSYLGLANITASANATDSDGSIMKVEFYNGSTLIGTSTALSNPKSIVWSNVAPGSYSITAKATDNLGGVTTSSAAAITVTNPITVAITAPANNAQYKAPAAIALTATASDVKGTISKIEFFNGATLIGTDTTAPYSVNWTNVAAGTYTITAKATDSQALTKTSTPITIIVSNNAAPTVSLTAPVANVSYTAPAAITLNANAADSDGTITKVEFYNGAILLATDTAAPYTFNWTNVAIGTYTLTAKATDNTGAITTSASVLVKVLANANPTLTLLTPANNAKFIAPATINLTSSATPASGNSIQRVDYFNGAIFIGTSTTAPYSSNWSGVAVGSYTITARATDNLGQVGTSSIATITVAANQAPTVTASATPINANAPATITLSATATDSDGSIAKVEFFNGATLLATVTQAPYTFNWTNVGAGTYSVTAKATDNLNLAKTSTPISVSVMAQVAQIYYVDNDHLNTPRTITDGNGNKVWEWKNEDAFGSNVPNDNPAGLGTFTFNQRMPGQYADKETGLFYNYYRDYDPSTGRYVESDPIGLEGGINTYGYVSQNPLSYIDPFGLKGDVSDYIIPAIMTVPVLVSAPAWVLPVVAVAGAAAAGTAIYAACNPDMPGVKKPPIADKEPKDLCELLALAEAKAGAGRPKMGVMNDEPRLIAHYGPGPWRKMEHTHRCPDGRLLTIHYFTNGRGSNVELKFV